jgi:hypothetical protein
VKEKERFSPFLHYDFQQWGNLNENVATLRAQFFLRRKSSENDGQDPPSGRSKFWIHPVIQGVCLFDVFQRPYLKAYEAVKYQT